MTICQLTDEVEEYLRNKRYAHSTIMAYRHSWNQLCMFAKMEGVNEYSFEYGLRFVKLHYGIDFSKLEPPFSTRHHLLYKAIKSLTEYQQGLPLSVYKKQPKTPLPEPYEPIINRYLDEYGRNVKSSSLEDAEYTLRKFAEFLCEIKITKLDDITATHICEFVTTLKDYVATTRNSWLARIRAFLKFSFEGGFSSCDKSVFVPKARYTPNPKLPSTYTKDEIERMLNKVDRANPIGKRNFAILKLAACLGMRSGDIVKLKFENFDWSKGVIQYEQEKGGNWHTLPLLNEVGESIIDYLKNGRPQSDLTFIFLKQSAPFTNLTAAALHPIMKKYRTLAKLPTEPPRKAGLHALRHSLASSLLEDLTPLPIISEILNHKKTETTRIYTRIDITSLRKCALEVPVPVMIGGGVNDNK